MKLTQQMTLHVNGGENFSELHYKVLADGKETGITIHKRTNGRPEYKYTAYEIHYGEETFDALAAHGKGMTKWIEERAKRGPPKSPSSAAPSPIKEKP
jgi:hypothetical protein